MNRRFGAKRMSGPGMRRWLVIGGIFILVTAGFLQYVYVAKHHPERLERFSQKVLGFTHWFTDRKERLKTGIDKKLTDLKALSAKPEDEDVHFEFYNALPAMQIAVSQQEVGKSGAVVKPSPIEEKKSSAASPQPAKVATIAPVKSSEAKSLFLDPDELERDFAKRFKPQTYVIQLGVFSTSTAADTFRQKLTAEHYKADIVKAYVGERHVYRVQVGPFTSKEQVETTQHVLKAKGMDGIVRKIG